LILNQPRSWPKEVAWFLAAEISLGKISVVTLPVYCVGLSAFAEGFEERSLDESNVGVGFVLETRCIWS
jgi:hypothetical protein